MALRLHGVVVSVLAEQNNCLRASLASLPQIRASLAVSRISNSASRPPRVSRMLYAAAGHSCWQNRFSQAPNTASSVILDFTYSLGLMGCLELVVYTRLLWEGSAAA